MKLKVGFGVEEDIACVRAVRECDRPRGPIDDRRQWGVCRAGRAPRAAGTQRGGVYFFEEPVAPEDMEGYRQLRGLTATSSPAEKTSSANTRAGRGSPPGALDIFQPDVAASGGFTELKKIAALCQAWHIPILPHVWGSGVCLAASLQLPRRAAADSAGAEPIEPLLEYDCSSHPFRGALIHDSLRPRDRRLRARANVAGPRVSR